MKKAKEIVSKWFEGAPWMTIQFICIIGIAIFAVLVFCGKVKL